MSDRPADAGSPPRSDLLGDALEIVKAYRDSGSPMAEARLRERRTAVARSILGLPEGRVAALAHPRNLEPLSALVRSGLRVLAPSTEELQIIDEARLILERPAPEGEAAVRATLAFCLLMPAHRLPRLPDFERLPPVLHELMLRILYAEPEFFVVPGEGEAYADFIEPLTLALLAFVEGGAPAAARAQLARQFTSHARFLSVYFNQRNLKPIYRARAAIVEHHLASTGLALDHEFAPRPAGRRIRVGVLRSSWLGGAETAATLAHLNGLDRSRFEIVLYAAMSRDGHPVERAVRAAADRFELFEAQDLAGTVARIRADDLDLMLIGANVTAIGNAVFVLSACRLARVQVALTLCPATTGLRRVDCFLNGALNEPPGAAGEYTERLVLVPGSINRYDFAGEPWPGEIAIPRSAFGVPEDGFVFASGANFYKLVPELLESWAELLRRVPESWLVLYPFNPNWTNLYPKELFSRHLRGLFQRHGVDPWRVRLLMPLASRAHIQAVLRQADLYLDSFPYSGAVSMMDPIGAGCPVLLCEGGPARNRQSTGMFRDGGFAGVIAADAGDYLEQAVRLAARPPELAELRRQAAAMAEGARNWSRLELNQTLAALALGPGEEPRA
jgi:hypothetical protein